MKKRFGVGIILLIGLVLALSVLAARLPTVGGDSGGWGTTLNDFLNIAHESGGNIKSGYITGSMIADTTIERGDLANDLINGTKIVDGGVGSGDINGSAINGTHISPSAALNVSNLTLGGANRTGGVTTGLVDISGIYFNKTRLNLPSITNQSCISILINLSGIPANAQCLPIADPNVVTSNLTLIGSNSTVDNCRILVCNQAPVSIDPLPLTYAAFGIVTSLDSTAAVSPL